MPDARSHRRQRSSPRTVASARVVNARTALVGLERGCEVYCLTFGQFSLIDALVALLEQTGPADVVVSTWTAGSTDLTTTANLLAGAAIRRLRFVVDRSFLTRQPGYCAKMRELFGDDCIRTMPSHCKFMTLRNEGWSLAVRTSMNLNTNPRLESIEVSDDEGLCRFLEQVADDLFAEQEPGIFNESRSPKLASIADKQAAGQVRVAAAKPATTRPRIG